MISNKLRKLNIYFIISLSIAIFLTFTMYPGVIMTDSNARWFLAEQILSSLKKDGFQHLDSWLSPTPSILFSIILLFTRNIAVFTFIQVLLFYFSSMCVIEKICKSFIIKSIAMILIIFMPPFWGFSVYHDMSVWIVIMINIFYLLLEIVSLEYRNFSNIKKSLYYIIAFLCLYMAFGFRQNAITLFPMAIFHINLVSKKIDDKRLKISLVTVLFISLISVKMIPTIIGIHTGSSQSAGFVWEILCGIQSLPEHKQEKYKSYLDYINGDGSTERSLNINNQHPDRAGEWLFRGDCFPLLSIGRKEIKNKIMKSYINMYIKEPKIMLKNKLKFILRTLGIKQKLIFDGYYENDINDYSKYGLSEYNKYRNNMIEIVNNFINRSGFFLLPWLWILISFLGIFLSKKNRYHSSIWLSYSIFYIIAFFINTQGFLYRYFYTANCFLFFSIISSLDVLFSNKIFGNLQLKHMLKKIIFFINKKIYTICIIIILFIILFISKNSVWLDNYVMIENMKKYGKKVYQSENISVWYNNNETIFIKDIDSEQSGYYYIHVYSNEKEYEIIDFYLIYNEIHTILYKDKRIAYIKLPDYKIYKIIVGYSPVKDMSLMWEKELFLN